jgi:hypothetical protein
MARRHQWPTPSLVASRQRHGCTSHPR